MRHKWGAQRKGGNERETQSFRRDPAKPKRSKTKLDESELLALHKPKSHQRDLAKPERSKIQRKANEDHASELNWA